MADARIARMAVVLISFLHSWPGAVEAQCALCGEGVYEQQANLDRMEAENGWVICVACALALKTVYPGLFPTVDAQLWEGHVRAPEMTAETKPIVDLLNKKSRP